MLTAPDPTRMARTPPGSTPSPAPPVPPRSPSTVSTADGNTAATIALVALMIVSASGLVRVFSGHRWFGPVLVTAIGVHAVCWAARRGRLPQLVALALALAALWVLTGWTVLGSSTDYGFPGGSTASHLWTVLGEARSDFAAAVTPVGVTTGFELMAVLGTGIVAILGDWGAFRWRSPLYGAAGPFAYFVVCCALGQGPGRQWAVGMEVTALLVFLLVHRATVGRSDQAWFGNQRAGTARWAITAGSLAAVASLLVAVAITPVMGKAEGRGILGWRSGFGNAGGGPRQVPNPVVDMHTRLLVEAETPVFRVQSPVPSYWRLTSLDTFTGQDWISTNSYRSFGAALPGTQAVPAGTRVVQEQFQIQQLGSVWLPDAFTPVAVTGVRNVSYDPTSGSLITSHPTSDGLAYSVTSYQYLSALAPAQVQSAPSIVQTGTVRHYLALPNSIPPAVIALARSITAGQTTEYGKALALQNFFLGPSFTYSLNPPDDGYGIDSLTTFLFNTRTGFCQQFAGAYAVLARAVGLPTRLAVGFATGNSIGTNEYQVLNSDAHTWPEVYFGPTLGWLPFEPTKSFVDPASKKYAPSTTASGPGADNNPAQLPAIQKLPQGAAGIGGANKAQSTTTVGGSLTPGQSSGHHGGAVGLALGLLVLAVMSWAVLVTAGRRVRWSIRRWTARGDPAALVRSRWADVVELLSWWGVIRETGETDEELAGRAGAFLTRGLRETSPWLPRGIVRLAGLATEAAFAPAVPATRADEAALVAREVHQRLFRSANARLLFRWAMMPRPARPARQTSDRPSDDITTGGAVLAGPWLAR
jgi:transglutaminase-like putative cysteine protease